MSLPPFFPSVPESLSLMIKQDLWIVSGLIGSMRRPERGKKLLSQTSPSASFLSLLERGSCGAPGWDCPLFIRKQCLLECKIHDLPFWVRLLMPVTKFHVHLRCVILTIVDGSEAMTEKRRRLLSFRLHPRPPCLPTGHRPSDLLQQNCLIFYICRF